MKTILVCYVESYYQVTMLHTSYQFITNQAACVIQFAVLQLYSETRRI